MKQYQRVFKGLCLVGCGIFLIMGEGCTRKSSQNKTQRQSWNPSTLTPEEQIQNLILNPDFEIPNDGDSAKPFPGYWLPDNYNLPGGYDSVDWDTSVHNSGSHSLKLTYGNYYHVNQTVLIKQWEVPNPADYTIQFSIMVKMQNIADGFSCVALQFNYYPGANIPGYVLDLPCPGDSNEGNGFVKVTGSFVPVAPVRDIYLRLKRPPSDGGIVWFDDADLRDGLNPPVPFPGPPSVVTMDQNNNVEFNGAPFFPLGIYDGHLYTYWDESDQGLENQRIISTYGNVWFTPDKFKEHVQDISSHGFNMLLDITGDNFREIKIKLDYLDSINMKAILTGGFAGWSGKFPLLHNVSIFKHHPAVLGWTISDETPPSLLDAVKVGYDLIKAEDPNHLVYMTTGDWPYQTPPTGMTTSQALAHQITTTDLLVPDWTSMCGSGPSGIIGTMHWTEIALDDSRPIWNNFQIYPTGQTCPQTPDQTNVPSPDQMKMMEVTALDHGAKGIILFEYSVDLPTGGVWYLPTSAAALWNSFTSTNTQINALVPVILARQKAQGERIVLQPTAQNMKDTYAWGASPGQNFDSEILEIGGASRSFLQFDMPIIPQGNIITQALLKLVGFTGNGQWPAGNYYVMGDALRVTQSWDAGGLNGITWNNQPLTDTTVIDSVHTVGPTTWNITPLVQGWVSGYFPNYGLMLKDHREFTTVNGEKDKVGTDGLSVKVEKFPLAYGALPLQGAWGWGIWDPHDPSTNLIDMNRTYDWINGVMYLGQPLPPGTDVITKYEYSWTSFADLDSSDIHTESDPSDDITRNPKLEIRYAPAGYVDEPLPLIGNQPDIDNAVANKYYDHGSYIFATNMSIFSSTTLRGTFDLPSLPLGIVDVLFEGRSLPLMNGGFRDTFAPFGTHFYKVRPAVFYASYDDTVNGVSTANEGTGTYTRNDPSTGTPYPATYLDSTGNIVEVGPNIPRFETGKAGDGVLIEQPSTNLILNSSFEVDGSWTWLNASVTPPYTTSPSIHGAQAVQFDSSDAQGYQDVTGLIPGQTYAISAYVRTTSQTTCLPFISVDDGTGSGQVTAVKLDDVPDQWERLATYFVATATGTARVHIQASNQGNSSQCGPVYYDAVQCEQGGRTTSYIPTVDTTRSRGNEYLTYSSLGNVPRTSGTISLWFKPETDIIPGSPSIAFFHTGHASSANNLMELIWGDGQLGFVIYDYTGRIGAVRSYQNFTANTWYHLVATYENLNPTMPNVTLRIYVNGTQVGEVSGISLDSFDPIYDGSNTYEFSIGYNLFGTWYSDSVLDNVWIFDRALSASEVNDMYMSSL